MKAQLFNAIDHLPRLVSADGNSVLQSWVTNLPRRHQGVMVTAVRGCDGAPKEDTSKCLSRMIRRAILNPHDERESLKDGGFFGMNADVLKRDVLGFMHSMDQYPLHYVMHLCHACEVIGYKHPLMVYRKFFFTVYKMMAFKFHLVIELEEELDSRLTYDRVKAGTVEADF